jgi:hypothetical protein
MGELRHRLRPFRRERETGCQATGVYDYVATRFERYEGGAFDMFE